MKTVEFNCNIFDGEASISASVNGVGDYEYYPCEDEETFYESIEFLDAREEILGRLYDIVEGMMRAIRCAETELSIERIKRENE